MAVDAKTIAAFKEARGIAEVAVRDMDQQKSLIIGVDERVYHEVATNIWAAEAERDCEVAYLGTGRHGGGIVLRPLFLKIDGAWYNASTGREAPAGMPFHAAATASRVAKDAEGAPPTPRAPFDLASIAPAERCESLARIAESTRWLDDTGAVYQNMVEAVARATHSHQAHLHLATVEGGWFARCASHDMNGAPSFLKTDWEDLLPATVGRIKWMERTLRPITMDYARPHPCDQIPEGAAALGLRSAASIPLVAGEDLIGMCSIVYQDEVTWSDEGLEYLVQIGRILGAAIERMRITKKAAELAILDERRRLASEIHDGVAHLVSALSLTSAAALESYDEGDMESLRGDIERLEDVTGKTLGVLRDEMLTLRLPLSGTDGFVEAVRENLARFEKSWGVAAKLVVKAQSDPLLVSPQASLQLMRILSECLSNILRHSGASRVLVSIEESKRALAFTVEDDGHGFDVEAVPPERLGLRIMRERAHAVGGKLTIVSGAEGTAVCAYIPTPFARGAA